MKSLTRDSGNLPAAKAIAEQLFLLPGNHCLTRLPRGCLVIFRPVTEASYVVIFSVLSEKSCVRFQIIPVVANVSFLCLFRKLMAVTRWPAPLVSSTSVGCAWASSAKSTHTVTLTTHIHLVTTSKRFFFFLLFLTPSPKLGLLILYLHYVLFVNASFLSCCRLFLGVDPDEDDDAFWSDEEDWHCAVLHCCMLNLNALYLSHSHHFICDFNMPALAKQCNYSHHNPTMSLLCLCFFVLFFQAGQGSWMTTSFFFSKPDMSCIAI